MPESVISVKNISKCYHLDEFHGESFKERLSYLLSQIFKKPHATNSNKAFWPLKDISFELYKGDVLGILGENGAGKSTLLKILSEVTKPSMGIIEIEGVVASVLELGMGFHPDLTGRENLLLSSNLMGITKKCLEENLDSIIEFSGIHSFIDIPIKHYSSGMYVRLAFALISHIEADILLFDEILSVGDASFKLKTLNKIRELTERGKTIILVTHNLNEINNVCNKAMYLEKGKLKGLGSPEAIISKYVEESHETNRRTQEAPSQEEAGIQKKQSISNYKKWNENEGPGNKAGRITKIYVKAISKLRNDRIYIDDPIEVVIEYIKTKDEGSEDVGFTLYDSGGNNVFASTSLLSDSYQSCGKKGSYTAVCKIPGNFLNAGIYTTNVFIVENEGEICRSLPDIIRFKIQHKSDDNKPWKNRFPGPLRPQFSWQQSLTE